ncbi:MAG: valine--tRNA ligase [Alphaproteobacteria bacterium]|nr:valine--tRNA ligase [Alphaproteobacteria bacterium]
MALDKSFKPGEVETRQYERWEKSGAFAAGGQRGNARPYTVVIPPPNVTGSLHIGHALNNSLQDILIRFERMRGRDTLWQPGTDHAGIATQMVVERQLEAQGIRREELGREAFIDRVWKWKAESGGTIIRQLRRLGASADWARERFTMDDGLSEAVRRVFVTLHKQGLIYRDKRLVNWDPRLHTAISDLEVELRETKGHLWHIKYPIQGLPNCHIVVATTRPETMLGDTAVAVHPDDERYKELIAKFVVLPLVGRRIPIVADEHADPEAGSGAVKITPAHDFNDFEVGKRHKLEVINIFDADAKLNENVPEPYRGMDRFEGRKKVVADLEAQGLLDKIADHVLAVPYGDRSGVVIEPWLTDQWYVDAKKLSVAAVEAVERGETVFVPRQWEKTFFEWMRNIQPWCISRQIWWGHQIPAWYGPDGQVFVETTEAEAKAQAKAFYGKETQLTRETDVLDTWFSSALWPFSTLGWPAETPELERYYPTDTLVTSFDIIFFWVARMMMMGLHFLGQVPFKHVYIHPLVRDEKGQKMSKSKGNVIDPLEFIDKYGADALRFTLAAMAAQGREIKLSAQRVEGYRNFATKVWNAAKFCDINYCTVPAQFDPASVRLTVNKWIVGELAKASLAVTQALEAFKFDQAASAIYQFTWGTFCDWYIEFIKPTLTAGEAGARAETRAAAGWVLGQILHLLHPIMPFLSEELWERMGGSGLLLVGRWPDCATLTPDAEAVAEMDWVVRLITNVRAVRSEMNVPAAAKVPMVLRGATKTSVRRLDVHRDEIQRLARVEPISQEPADARVPTGSAQIVHDEAVLVLPLAGVVDIEAERKRLQKELDRVSGEIAGIERKLANADFVARAPEHVVAEQQERKEAAIAARGKLNEALQRIAAYA